MILAAAGLLIGGFVVFRYVPRRRQMQQLQRATAAARAEASRTTAQAGQLPQLKRHLVELQSTVGDYDSKIPHDRQLGPFLQTIAGMMDRCALTDQLIEPGEEIEVGALRCIPVSMRCVGELKQVFEFFVSLQDIDRLVRIKKVKLANDKDFSGRITMQTEAFIYYRPTSPNG